ncbi:hypothetical protein [Clostridium rectalis]|uniref:hypothetical protein n=1 Tax=Clostridium rectalis TaxID=2040295 RepID=UPI000F6436F3|nr:hypothetical protein [Clostridium rectalis]
MVDACKEDLVQYIPKSDTIVVYDKNGQCYGKVSYECFYKKEFDDLGLDLKELIYNRYNMPSNYKGIIFSIKNIVEDNNISYEVIEIQEGKIKEYNFQLYDSIKNEIPNQLCKDIENIIIEKYKEYNKDNCIKYRSMYNKKKVGFISLQCDCKDNKIEIIIDKNIKFSKEIRRILNQYPGFLLKVEVIDS